MTTRKSVGKKKTSAKTAKTIRATRTPRRSAAGQAGTKAGRAKLALLAQAESLALLDRHAIEKLEKKAEALADTKDPLAGAAAWDRALGQSLSVLETEDEDSRRAVKALVAWQDSLRTRSETKEGIGQALTGLRRVLPFDGATLFLRSPGSGKMAPWLTLDIEVELIARIRFADGMGFSSWVASRQKPVLYSSIHRNEAPGATQIRSFLSVPLVVGGECVGVLNLGRTEDGAYGPGSLRTLVVAGGMLAGLVQRYLDRVRIAALEIEDPESGFATSTYLERRLREEVVRCRELGHAMTLVRIQLNELEPLAEQFGPDFRSRVRDEMTELVRAWRRPTDLVGHGARDSLLVLMPAARRETALARIGELRQAVEAHNFPRRKRMSLGAAAGTYPADAEDPQELLVCVDKALQESSRAGTGHGAAYPSLVA